MLSNIHGHLLRPPPTKTLSVEKLPVWDIFSFGPALWKVAYANWRFCFGFGVFFLIYLWSQCQPFTSTHKVIFWEQRFLVIYITPKDLHIIKNGILTHPRSVS